MPALNDLQEIHDFVWVKQLLDQTTGKNLQLAGDKKKPKLPRTELELFVTLLPRRANDLETLDLR